MSHKGNENGSAKERIIRVSEQLFSQKGFDATRVDEIAQAAEVNKALIYYYFKSKEHILDHLIETLFDDIEMILVSYVQDYIIEMIRDGRLDIEPDRLHFVNEEALRSFLSNTFSFYRRIVDRAIERRPVFRILMMESLKNSKHQHDLFALLRLLEKSDANPIFRAISNADGDYDYPYVFVVLEFFFRFMPIVSFAAYFDDYKAFSSLDEQQLKESFVHSLELILSGFISGTDILLGDDVKLPDE